MDIYEHCYQTLAGELAKKYCERDERVMQAIIRRDKAAILARAERIRKQIRRSVLEIYPDCDLNPSVTGEIQLERYCIEKVSIQTLPGSYIPINVYRPAEGQGPFPAIIVPMGHWPDGKTIPDNQTLCANLAMHGFVVATYDPICQGERMPFPEEELPERFGDMAQDLYAVSLHMIPGNLFYLLGKNLISLFVHDGMRVIDYISARADVDPERLGVTGQSGGGTQTTYLAALDDRIKVYSPIQCLSQNSLMIPQNGIGDCEQSLIGISSDEGFEYVDILYASLPKPVMVNSGLHDMFYIEGVRQIEAEMSLVYGLLSKKADFSVTTADCPHLISPGTRANAYSWFNRVLRHDDEKKVEIPVRPQEEAALACLKEKPTAKSPLEAPAYFLKAAKLLRPADANERREKLRVMLDIHERQTTREKLCNGTEVLHVHGARSISFSAAGAAENPVCLLISNDCALKENLQCEFRVLEAQPWAMASTYAKERHGYDNDTMVFNAAVVAGECIMADRVNEVIALGEELCREYGMERIRLVGGGYGALIALLASAMSTRFEKTVLIGMPDSLDALFEDEEYLFPETLIVPGIVEVADVADLLDLVQGSVLNLNPADTRWKPLAQPGICTAEYSGAPADATMEFLK